MRGKTALCGALAILVAGGLVVLAPAVAWGETPEKGSVARALEYAPKGTVGVIHVNVRSAGRAAVKELAKAKIIGQDTVKALLPVLGKIESAEVYVVGPEGPPMPVVVLRGRITAADVATIAKVFGLPPFKKQANGRYGPDVRGGPPVLAILGAEATDLPAGVTVIGLAGMLQPEFFKTFGQQNSDKVVALLKGVNTSADIWGAADLSGIKEEDAPRSIKGCLFVVTKGRSKIDMVFKDAKYARQIQAEFNGAKTVGKALAEAIEINVKDKRVTIASKTTDPLLPKLVAGLARARTLAKRAGSMACLKGIGTGIAIYINDGVNDAWPPDLEALVKDKQPPKLFVSPSSGRKSPYDAKGKFRSDYIYIKGVPPAGPGHLIVVYEPPEFNDFECVLVLDYNGSVSRLTPEEFKREIERTEKWFKENGKTFTMDPKTRAWLKTVGKKPKK